MVAYAKGSIHQNVEMMIQLDEIGEEREFETALDRLRGSDADISQEAADIKVNLYQRTAILQP
ncbi:hypothetical protein I3842_07G013800 [Carya illinoinensis]|uniref:Uncharacterized protein n=1 Tax=Carya illinoinensis TaxID=32201 RepID=A0A922EHF2_CARIL|nr:hypothetical protein I3842_07G013800 [Carya illinoinensis]